MVACTEMWVNSEPASFVGQSFQHHHHVVGRACDSGSGGLNRLGHDSSADADTRVHHTPHLRDGSLMNLSGLCKPLKFLGQVRGKQKFQEEDGVLSAYTADGCLSD